MSSPSVLHWHWPPTSLTTGASLHWSTWRTTSQSHQGTFRQGTSTSPTCQLSVINFASHPYFPEVLSGEGEFQSNFFWHSSNIFGQMWGLSFLLQELAVEFCLLSLEKEVYDLYKSKEINSPSCYDLKDLTTINDDEEDSPETYYKKGKGKKRSEKIKRRKKNRKEKKVTKGNKHQKMKKKRMEKLSQTNDERSSGASAYPSDTQTDNYVTSMYHPWQCSMRLQGFRGRHKCGVTLLSGGWKLVLVLVLSVLCFVCFSVCQLVYNSIISVRYISH